MDRKGLLYHYYCFRELIITRVMKVHIRNARISNLESEKVYSELSLADNVFCIFRLNEKYGGYTG